MSSRDEARGASKARRMATTELYDQFGVNQPPGMSRPRSDYDDALTVVSEVSGERADRRAMRWYRKGLVRGMTKALDWVLEGDIELEGATLTTNKNEFVVKVRVRLRGNDWESRRFRFKPDAVGFKDTSS